MKYEDVMKFFGGTQKQVAIVLGVRQTTVSAWVRSGVPYGRQCEIQLMSDGILTAEKESPHD